jgi:AcrR family transcriptional regulator
MAKRPRPRATRPPKRSARHSPLSEQEVVAAALEIIAERGVDGLTMRGLSDHLGVALGATYKHVPNKRVLLALVADELFSRVEDTDPQDEEWFDRMHALFVRVYDTFRAHPGLAEHVAHSSPGARPPHLRSTLGKILSDAGFSDAEVDDLMSALFFYTTGALLSDAPTVTGSAGTFAAGLDLLLRGAQDELRSASSR